MAATLRAVANRARPKQTQGIKKMGLKKKRQALSALIAITGALSGCGGGGGSSTDPQAAPPAPTVQLTNVRLPTLTATVYEGQTGDSLSSAMSSTTIMADLSGDLAALNGKTIYVRVHDPDRVLESAAPFLPLSATDSRLGLSFTQNNPAPGSYVGPLTVDVCWDAACTQRFGGSPITVPYQIQVLPGLKTDLTPLPGHTLIRSAPNTETRQVVTVTPAQGMQTWTAEPISSQGRFRLEPIAGETNKLALITTAGPAGSFRETIVLRGFATKPNGGRTVFLSVAYAINLEVM